MNSSRRNVAAAMLMLAVTAGLLSAQSPPVSSATPLPRTALVVGQVVDAVSGDPVAGSVVRLTMRSNAAQPGTAGGRVITDDDGRFFFSELPAGEYFLRTTLEGYAGGAFDARNATEEGQPFRLADGERRTEIRLPLWKHAAVAGTVVDESGEPVVGVSVYALRREFLAGRVRFGALDLTMGADFGPRAQTDDRGVFRISGLIPGSYVVVVPSTQTTIPAATLRTSSQNPNVQREVLIASSEVQVLGQPRTQQLGEMALLTKNRVAAPPPAMADGRLSVYRTTYFPTATAAVAAKEIEIGAGEERTGISIALLPVPSVQVSGRLVRPDGSAPPPMAIRLVGEAAADVADTGFETVTGVSESDGRFTLLGVPAGEYTFKTSSRVESLSRQNLPAFWANQRISVGAKDVADLAIDLKAAIRLTGRVEYRTSASPAPRPARGVEYHPASGDDGRFAAEYIEGRTFSVASIGGVFTISPFESGGWHVESVMAEGKNVTDTPVELLSVTTPIVITYTDRAATLSGTVKDSLGKPGDTAAVLVFPTAQAQWTNYGFSPRKVKKVNASRGGAYTLENLPAGDYYAIAVDSRDTAAWTDPKRLAAFVPEATRFTMAAATPKTLDLTLKAVR